MALSVVAIIAAYNESDIIGQVVADLIAQGISVYFLDDHSTDATVAAVEPYLGRGVIGIEHLGDTFGSSESSRYEWERILRRKVQLATELGADWYIHHDADEFRESPWFQLTLNEAIQKVDDAGFNAIDFASFDFWPVDNGFKPDEDIRRSFCFYSPPKSFDRLQIRCWKKTQRAVELASSGGHQAQFDGRKVFPVRFILRHYPIRSQTHGERKIFRERQPRFLQSERTKGWHVQYEDIHPGTSFVRHPSSLRLFDPDAVRLELMVHHRAFEECDGERAAVTAQIPELRQQFDAMRFDSEAAHAKVATLEGQVESLTAGRDDSTRSLRTLNDSFQRTTDALRIQTAEVAQLRTSLEHAIRQNQELQGNLNDVIEANDSLRANIDAHVRETERVRSAYGALRDQLDDLHESKSWRLTAPLRAIYGAAVGGVSPPTVDPPEQRPTFSWGDLARVTPISSVWGTDRGLPVDRHYIHRFLDQHRSDIRGRVLEVKDSHYASTFGGSHVQETKVLDIDLTNPRATIVADLAQADHVQGNQFDCFILTQTLHIIYDIKSALGHAARLLKPGGVLLCTIPAVSRVNYENGGLDHGDFWRLTRAAVTRLFAEVFASEQVAVSTYGNVRICTAFLYGLATEDLEPHDLTVDDPWFPLIHCVRAVKR